MPPRPKYEPLAFLCSVHGRYVKAGSDPGRLDHVSEGIDRTCRCERFTRIRRDEATRTEVLAELAALAGEDGEECPVCLQSFDDLHRHYALDDGGQCGRALRVEGGPTA